MNKMIKVGKIPGKLVQIVLDDNTNYTAKEVFDLANIEIDDNYTINDGSSKIGLNDTVHGSILVASAKIKGNSGRMIKVGKIPGKLVQIVLDDNTNYTAKEVFDLANIEIDENYTINDGSSKISLNDTVHGSILVASAKIKGNSTVYVLKDYIESSDISEIPFDMVNGTFNLVSDIDGIVVLEDINNCESFTIQKHLFENLFEAVHNNANTNSCTENVKAFRGNDFKAVKTSALRRFIISQIDSLQEDVKLYNLKISNASNQITFLQSILSELNI